MAPDNGDAEKSRYIATKADIARLEEQVKGLDRAVDIRITGIEILQSERSAALRDVFVRVQTAVDKAELAQHNVNKTANEFRGTLSDQAKLMVTRPEMETLDKRVQALERGAVGGEGRHAGFDAFKGNLFAILALLLALASFYVAFQKSGQVDSNTRAIDRQTVGK